MSQPLGAAIGNALEVAEAVQVLKGELRGRLRELSTAFVVEALCEMQGTGRAEALAAAERALDRGSAVEAFGRMVQAQGGDPRVVEHPEAVLPAAEVRVPVSAPGSGYLSTVDAEALGRAAAALGAGRMRKGDSIDPAVGIDFLISVGDRLEGGQEVAIIHARDDAAAAEASARVMSALEVRPDPAEVPVLIQGWHGGPS
jgi:thymidine phosphorylase